MCYNLYSRIGGLDEGKEDIYIFRVCYCYFDWYINDSYFN